MCTNNDSLQDELTRKIAEYNDKIAEYTRLMNHLREHDCSMEDWVQHWEEANMQALTHDGKTWYYKWDSNLSAWDSKHQSFTGPSPQHVRALNAKAAYEFAKQIEHTGLSTDITQYQQVVFERGKLLSYIQTRP